jgi:galactosylceramidase
MLEAKRRNPNILLDCLEWGAPGWIGDGKFYSDDNIKYIVAFIKGAQQYHNLTIDFTGIWNERMYNVNFIKNLRKALDENKLDNVKIVAADLCCGEQWLVADDMVVDRELFKAIDIVGDHYPEREKKGNSSENAKSTGKPIWNSEGGPWKSDWSGFKYLAEMYNRNYIEGRITKNITWSLITSYYNTLSLPNSGLMTANSPWSGYYSVDPALWATAHTTQFTKPGWQYLDNACGYFNKKGSYVTMVDISKHSNLSIIAETMDASDAQTVTFSILGETKIDRLFVWRSVLGGQTLELLAPIRAKNNKFTLTLEPKALYTITTTTGQQKANAAPAVDKPFPLPFMTGFENEKIGLTPKYFMDQSGAFEIAARHDGKGHCLRQIVTRKGIEWEDLPAFNETVIGDTASRDGSVSTLIHFSNPYSYGSVFLRATEMHRSHELPEAYQLKLEASGKWSLLAGKKQLASGLVRLEGDWQNIALSAKGTTIEAFLNNTKLISLEDTTYQKGLFGLGCSHHQVDFDDFVAE